MLRPSLAEGYFRELVSKPSLFDYLSGLAATNSPAAETDWLDFKGAARISDTEVKRIWSKTLTAFANTQGGVLIWGLDCRRDGGPAVDRVLGVSLVANPDSFASRLKELHRQASDPPALGIEIRAVPNPADPTRGFVVCFVPESEFKPLRAEQADRQFYIRAGDASVVPSMSVLRSLFAPGSIAELGIMIEVTVYPEKPVLQMSTCMDFSAFITNHGLVSVAGCLVTLHGAYGGGGFRLAEGWPMHPTPSSPHSFESPRAIYPGERMLIFTFRHGTHLKEANAPFKPLPLGFEQRFELRILAHNQPPIRATTTFVAADIDQRAKKQCELALLA